MTVDSSLYFSNAQVITANGNSTTELRIHETGIGRGGIVVHATRNAGTSATLDVDIYAGDTSGSLSKIGQLTQIGNASGSQYGRFDTDKEYMVLVYTIGGSASPNYTVTSFIDPSAWDPTRVVTHQ